MVHLPPPTALLSGINTEESEQPQHANAEHSLSNRIGGLSIDTKHNASTLPSIHALLNEVPATDRRLSDSPASLCGSDYATVATSIRSGSSTPQLPHLELSGQLTPHLNSLFMNQVWCAVPCTHCGDALQTATDRDAGLCSSCSSATPTPAHQSSAPRRLRQVYGQLTPGFFPYPTPHNSPEQKPSRLGHPSTSRRSPSHWRYNDTSDAATQKHLTINYHQHLDQQLPAQSRQSSVSSDSEKPAAKKPRNKKAVREYHGRQDLSAYLAGLYNVCLQVNPNMGVLAAPRPGVPNGGWRLLKSNNINKEIANPLMVNKTDSLSSGITVIAHSNCIINQAIAHLRKLGLQDFADEFEDAARNRGCIGFHDLRLPDPKP